jgi:ActR/RegA family two-component response regulator
MAEAEERTAQPARSVGPVAERILIVEDDDSIATNLARALSAYGYSSAVCERGGRFGAHG